MAFELEGRNWEADKLKLPNVLHSAVVASSHHMYVLITTSESLQHSYFFCSVDTEILSASYMDAWQQPQELKRPVFLHYLLYYCMLMKSCY